MAKLKESEVKALEALARDGDTYIVEDARVLLITDGRGFRQDLAREVFETLCERDLIRERGLPHYWFITTQGHRLLAKATR